MVRTSESYQRQESKLTRAVLYHQPVKQQASQLAKAEIRAREQELEMEKRRLGMTD